MECTFEKVNESLTCAAQSQSVSVNSKINISKEDLLCRLCKKANENTGHVASAESLHKRSIKGDMTTKVR